MKNLQEQINRIQSMMGVINESEKLPSTLFVLKGSSTSASSGRKIDGCLNTDRLDSDIRLVGIVRERGGRHF